MDNKDIKIRNYKKIFIIMNILLVILSLNLVYAFHKYNELRNTPLSLNVDAIESLANDDYMHSIRSLPIVSVSPDTDNGEVDKSYVKLIDGNNRVLIDTSPYVEPDLQYSAEKSVYVAKNVSQLDTSNHDFVFYFDTQNAYLLGGESAGVALTLNSIALLDNLTLRNDSVITGTINLDGTIGKVGGLKEKAKAVANAGYSNFLIPQGQANITIHDKKLVQKKIAGFSVFTVTYVSNTLDLKEYAKEQWGLNVIEVSNIYEALSFFENKTYV